MRTLFYLPALVCLAFPGFGQWIENFSDGDLTQNPQWSGESTKFIIENGILRLNDIDFSGKSSLNTSFEPLETMDLSFYFKMDFNPSTSNFLTFQVSNGSDKVWQLKLGGNTADEIQLFDTQGKLLFQSQGGQLNTASPEGWISWKLENDSISVMYLPINDSLFIPIGKISNAEKVNIQHLEMIFTYTTTRYNKFYIDNIQLNGTPYQDTTPPSLISWDATSPNTVFLEFSEPLTQISPENILLSPFNIHPATIKWMNDQNALEIFFLTDFPNGEDLQLQIINLSDLAGNKYNGMVNIIYVEHRKSDFRNIIFSEIMYDPTPVIGLPQSEYLELYNRSKHPFKLDNWQVSDGLNSFIIDHLILKPGEYILFVPPAKSIEFDPNISLKEVEGWLTLNNTGKKLILQDNEGEVVDSLTYQPAWHQSSKSSGGWSLEIIDIGNNCSLSSNWTSSNHLSGGTPGRVNQQEKTASVKALINSSWYEGNMNKLIVAFNQPLDPIFIKDIKINIQPLDFTIKNIGLKENELEILLSGIASPESLYSTDILNLKVCGDTINNSVSTQFAYVSKPQRQDIIFNEILVDPAIGGMEFIEVLNTTNYFFDLEEITFLYQHDFPNKVMPFTSSHTLLQPNKPVAITPGPAILKSQYPFGAGNEIIPGIIPSMASDYGYLNLYYDSLLLDSIKYSKSDHFSLLKTTKGVTLERVYNKTSEIQESKWVSSSAQNGYGTPGNPNSNSFSIKNLP
ncbi:MAG: lamin tail domain-containing protein, partial [Cyclobacteriaceae bacterium]|nr:lamin tail domain-containing protein [Cyclobacteriaceae bacterium]